MWKNHNQGLAGAWNERQRGRGRRGRRIERVAPAHHPFGLCQKCPRAIALVQARLRAGGWSLVAAGWLGSLRNEILGVLLERVVAVAEAGHALHRGVEQLIR